MTDITARLGLLPGTPVYVFDTETYPNFSMVGFKDVVSGAVHSFTTEPGIGDDFTVLKAWWEQEKPRGLFVGFNCKQYDNAMLAGMLAGESAETLYRTSATLIANRKGWGRDTADGELQIDLLAIHGVENIGSLKELAIKLDVPKLQELPFDPTVALTHEQMQAVASYNQNDLLVTERALLAMLDLVALRMSLTAEKGVDVLSKRDSGLADAVMRTALFGSQRPPYPNQRKWQLLGSSITAAFDYHDVALRELRDRIAGWVIDYELREVTEADGSTRKTIVRPTFGAVVEVAGKSYQLGIGGLHSIDQPAVFEADDTFEIIEFDVSSFYPSLITNHQIVPRHLPRQAYLKAFETLRQERLDAKAAGKDALADGLKVAINSVFGKHGSAYGWLSDPPLNTTVTLTGQLTLLALVDLLAIVEGVEVISANTDAVVVKARRDCKAREMIAAFGDLMNLHFGEKGYSRLIRRDINNYVGLTTAGKVVGKGAYNSPTGNLTKKATTRIVVTAVQQFLLHDVPVADTIRACRDVREFIDYSKAMGGWQLEDGDGNPCGRLNRYYFSTEGGRLNKRRLSDQQVIKVADGVTIIADLPDAFPDDIDYSAYEELADRLIQPITNPDIRQSYTVPLDEFSSEQRKQYNRNLETLDADPQRCANIDLSRALDDYSAVFKGNKYDSMKSLLVRAWLAGKGELTRGDLAWIAVELDSSEGYFATPQKQRTLERMLDWITREISPFHRPKSLEECASAALTWAKENVEPVKRKRKLNHNGVYRSSFINGDALRRYSKSRDDYRLACSIAAVATRHEHALAEAELVGMLKEVRDAVEQARFSDDIEGTQIDQTV